MMLAWLRLAAALTSVEADAQRALEANRRENNLPGVTAAMIVDGRMAFTGAVGVADIESGRKLTPDTPLYAGSVSKVFTAVLVLQAVDRGEMTLDTHPNTGGAVDDATVLDLLTHSAGLPRESDFNYWFTGVFPDKDALDTYLREQPLRDPPGRRLSYSNIGYAALGRMLERVSDRPYAELLAARVAGPLRFATTGAGQPPETLSRGYTPRNRLSPNNERPFAGVGPAVGDRRLREYHGAAAMTPAFGIYSSARDLARFGSTLVEDSDNDLLPVSARRQMLTRQRHGRGFGLRIDRLQGRTVARHGGWFAAHRSHLLLDDEANIAIAVLVNSDDGHPGELAEALYRVALATAELD